METILVKAAGLALMIFAGYGLKRLGVFRTEDAKVISRIVVHLTLPAALITGFRTFHFDASYLALIVIALVSNFALLGVGCLVVSLDGYSLTTSFTAALGCLSTVGPGLDLVGPMGNFGLLSGFNKVFLSLLMLIGRLEIFPILLLFLPSTWRRS